MKICLIGGFSGKPDEGMKIVSNNIRNLLALKHEVLTVLPNEIFCRSNINSIRKFKPHIVHYLHGPTIRSLIALKIVKSLMGRKTRIICSATRPFFSKLNRKIVSLTKPDVVLTQSRLYENFFVIKGCNVKFLPNGVDCEKFSPASYERKAEIRRKLMLPINQKIILHVGHLRKNRNLEIFIKIQQIDGLQVVIVAGDESSYDEELKKRLQESGIIIYQQFYNDISKFYKMADLYVFPVKNTSGKFPDSYNRIGAIDMPLSVLEAMACNLPVLTTYFDAFSRVFEVGGGFKFCNSDDEILNDIERSFYAVYSKTRRKVMPYSWDCIIDKLERIYKDTIEYGSNEVEN